MVQNNKELQGPLEEAAYNRANKELGAGLAWKYDFIVDTGQAGTFTLDFKETAKRLPKSEIWAARVIKEKYNGYIHYLAAEDKWYLWNGVVHMPLEDEDTINKIIDQYYDVHVEVFSMLEERAFNWVKSNVLTEKQNAELVRELKKIADHKRYRTRLEESAGKESLKRELKKRFRVTMDYFEADRDYIVFADGQVINLRTPGFDLEPADPKRPVIKHVPHILTEDDTYEKHTPFRWFATLDEWLPNKDEQEFLQFTAGAALLAEGKAKNIPTLVGVSNTGKSTYIRTMAKVFGLYAGFLDRDAIVDKTTNFDQYKARGVRFLYLEEPKEAKVDDSFLKNLSGGGGEISTQEKHKNTLTWKSQAMLHIASNHVPKINAADNAIVERLNVIMFTKVFKLDDSHTVESLEDVLFAEEGLGIFLWALEGAKKYRESGLQSVLVCESIKERALNNISLSSLPVAWLTESIKCGCYSLQAEANANTWVEPKIAYLDFQAWLSRENERKEPSRRTWTEDIHQFLKTPENKQGQKGRSNGRNYLWTVVKNELPVDPNMSCDHIVHPEGVYPPPR